MYHVWRAKKNPRREAGVSCQPRDGPQSVTELVGLIVVDFDNGKANYPAAIAV